MNRHLLLCVAGLSALLAPGLPTNAQTAATPSISRPWASTIGDDSTLRLVVAVRGASARAFVTPESAFVLAPRPTPHTSSGPSPFGMKWTSSFGGLAGIGFSAGRIEGPLSVTPANELPGVVNYYLGSDPALWRPGLKAYASLRFAIHELVDVEQTLEEAGDRVRVVVRPPFDPAGLFFRFHHGHLSVGPDGALQVASFNNQVLRFGALHVSQPVAGGSMPIEARWLTSSSAASIVPGEFDRSREVVIEFEIPRLVATPDTSSPMFGGNATAAVDREGNVFVAGPASSVDRGSMTPLFDAALTPAGVFVVQKLGPDGTPRFTTYVGGAGGHQSLVALSPDGEGGVWVAGVAGPGFPVTVGERCTQDCYSIAAVRLGPEGKLLASRHTSALRGIRAVAIDEHGVHAAVGNDSGFQAPEGLPAAAADTAWLAKIDPSRGVVYRTKLGNLVPSALAITPEGRLVVGGMVFQGSALLSTAGVPGLQKQFGGGASDGFVLLVDPLQPGVKALRAATYLGGAGGNIGFDHDTLGALALHPGGDVVVTGYTLGAFSASQGKRVGGKDIYVVRLSSDLSRVRSSFAFGGANDDMPSAIAIDSGGAAWINGFTASPDFPRVHAIPELDSGPHLFLTRVNSAGSAVIDSTFLGRSLPGMSLPIAVGPKGSVYVGGISSALAASMSQPGGGALETGSHLVLLRVDPCASCPAGPGIVRSTRDGDSVVLEGRGFASAARILAGSVPADDARIVSASRIEIEGVPADVTEISVVNPDGQSATVRLEAGATSQKENKLLLYGGLVVAGLALVGVVLLLAGWLRKRLRARRAPRKISSGYRPRTGAGTVSTPRPASPASTAPPPHALKPPAPARRPLSSTSRRPPAAASKQAGAGRSSKNILFAAMAVVLAGIVWLGWRPVRRALRPKPPEPQSVYLAGTGFTLKMHCMPQPVQENVRTSQGEVPMKTWRCENDRWIEYGSVIEYPMDAVYNGTFNAELAIQDAVDAALRGLGAKVVSTRPALYNGSPGRDIVAEMESPELDEAVVRMRVFVTAWRVNVMVRAVPKGDDNDEDARTFFHLARNQLIEPARR